LSQPPKPNGKGKALPAETGDTEDSDDDKAEHPIEQSQCSSVSLKTTTPTLKSRLSNLCTDAAKPVLSLVGKETWVDENPVLFQMKGSGFFNMRQALIASGKADFQSIPFTRRTNIPSDLLPATKNLVRCGSAAGSTFVMASEEDFLSGRGDIYKLKKLVLDMQHENPGMYTYEHKTVHVTEEVFTEWVEAFQRLKARSTTDTAPPSNDLKRSSSSSSSSSNSSSQDDPPRQRPKFTKPNT
jgi:hypothetical protein